MGTMSDFLCVGDLISLYCEETEGYVYNNQSSSAHNGCFIYQWQDREKPTNVPNPQAVSFQICIQNRYKLNKKYRKILPANGQLETLENEETKTIMHQARLASEAENDDNVAEQRRQHGKRVRYGEVMQLKHVFSSKFIHVSTTQTSRRDKNNMLVSLSAFNAKHAQFKILPRYKVKSEGEFVQIFDQIILESVKSPGQYLHASAAWKIDHFNIGSELNLGIQPAGFTVVKNCRPVDEHKTLMKLRPVQGGNVIRLFHKELEAYLVAEGLFDDEITEDVHLRIREVDQLVPKSLYPSTSANTYWQIEAESSILNGEVIRWEQQVRFRHITTRQYLCITSDRRVTLTPDSKDPRTVFRLHPVIKEADEIQFESYARIEHVITGYWLHALRDEEYVRKQLRETNEECGDSMKSLRWDGAVLRKISASGEKMYHDAYTLQVVESQHLVTFNFVGGMVPFLLNLILDRNEGNILNAKKAHKITVALEELKDFMIIKGVATKERQKLMRNLRVIDLLVRLLQFPLEGAIDQAHLTRVFKGAYEVLYTYMIGNSRKNSLYFAKYIDFFQTQITVKGDIGLNVAQMIVELIRDNRKIVDRITREQIEMFVGLLRQNKNYRYLDLLNVMCVCDGVAIPDNQTYITDMWLRQDRLQHYQSGARILTERGQNVNGQPNIIYVSTENGTSWIPLHEFVDKDNIAFNEEDVMFFEHQLDLYGKLAYGRNDFAIFVITRELGILTWDEAFLSMRSSLLPDALRAKYCELIIGLFIDVGTNYSVLDHTNLSFIYEDVLSPGPNADGEFVKKLPRMDNWITSDGIIKDLVTLFPVIRDWIAEFLDENKDMTACMVGRNMLIEQVLRLFHFLVKFGYYGSDDIKSLLKPLLNLLNGKHDKPFPPDNQEKGSFSKDAMKQVNVYRNKDRYNVSPETAAIVNAKYQAMAVLDLLLTFQFNTRLESFIAKFKTAETTAIARKKKQQSVLSPLLYEFYDAFDVSKKGLKQQKKSLKELRSMFESTAYFDSEQITSILMDLSNYKYDKMINKSLALLNKYYSSKTKLFKMAVQAMVLITTDSCHVHREIARTMPILRRYSKAKLNDDQVKTMGGVLERYTEFCHLPKEENERHPMNQNILINHEVLTLVFDILSQEIDAKLMEQYRGIEEILKKSLKLLKSLARGNDVVQMRMFERLDTLLKIKVVEPDLAIALKETYIGNQVTCLKVLPQQIQTIVNLAAEHQEKAPEFLDLLNVIVKVEGLGLTLKRNQAYVMKFIMQDYNKLAYVLDQPREFREKILTLKMGKNHLNYLINLIDLLATCAEGENRFIESMCQTILGVEELLWVMNHAEIDNNLKRPFLRYFLWVYMKTAGSAVESGAGDLPHDGSLWKFLQGVAKDACELTEYISKNQETGTNLLKKPPDKSEYADPSDIESIAHCTLHYFFDTVMPIIQAFFTKFYIPEKDVYPAEVENTDKLARALVGFCEAVIPLVSNPAHLKAIISCITAVIPSSTVPNSVMEGLIEQLRSTNRLRESRHQIAKMDVSGIVRGHKEYYQGELELNAKLRTFAVNCSLLYGGHNTVQAQLKFKSKREYTTIGGDDELPLGEEFQEHLRRFLRPNEKKVTKRIELVRKIVDQLAISSSMHRKLTTEAQRIEQEELDIRCLQILRAVIHNEERKLPEDWEENPQDHKKQVQLIRDLQIEMNEMGAVINVLPHLARPSDRIAKEVLGFICIMLFNANAKVQSSLLHYFLHTREESFFAAIRNRMHLSALAIKERRSLAAQQRSRQKEVMAQTKSMQNSISVGRKALQEIEAIDSAMKKNKFGQGRKVSLSTLQSKAAKRREEKKHPNKPPKKKKPKEAKVNGFTNDKMKDSQTLINSEQIEMEPIEVTVEKQSAPTDTENKDNIPKEDDIEEIDQKDDGYIELVLRVLARMCDGQHEGLQDYLREQPDNMKSFNIVAETAQFVNLVYSNINPQNLELVIQLFETLNEFTVGNQSNRYVLLNSKVVDYINFILRAAEFKNCSLEKVLELKQCIGNLLISLIEENSPESLQVAKEIKDTLDKEAIYRCMGACFEMQKPDRPKLDLVPKGNLNIGMTLQSAKNLAKLGKTMLASATVSKEEPQSQEVKEIMDEVGFTYFLILARLHDIDPKLSREEINISPLQQEAFNHYKKNTMSIEILKDDNLQKVNFRVKNKNVLRDEVKEKMTWSVDRSSPSNKIRDLMKWSKDILKDIYYQRKILSNPIATFFTKNWLFWNRMCILLSLAINALMLATWNARATLLDGKNSTWVHPGVYDPKPVVKLEQYDVIIYALGGAHNFFALLVLVTYFLSNHPTLPTFSLFRKLFSKCKRTNKENPEKDKEDKEMDLKVEQEEIPKVKEEHESKLEVQLFSVSTLYYLIFLGLSVAGTIFQGYFFAFHLLNIVNNNQLLRGVIQAVTQNGKSLVWVAVLGLIVFYLYALISFAMLRSSFDEESNMYCSTLWQCTITVIRYGLIGDIFESLTNHPSENTFMRFGFLVIFHLSFFIFITTIGLNIIFGIIVDTFSELRDLKWQAERDMRDTCFICSRGSYDFEHHGKGFEHHINVEHHIWAYIFFFIHLHDTKQSDYTSLELHVFKLLQFERYDFFPLNRALSLSAMDEDSTESKVDDLLRFVMTLVERQKEEDSRKKREEERQKQLRWREEHRNALMQGGDSMDTQDSNGPHGKLNRRPSGGRQRFRQKRWQRGSKSQYGMGDSLDTQDTLDSSLSMGKILTAGKDGLMDSTDDPPDNNALDTSGASELEARSPSPRGHPGALTTSSPAALDGSLPLLDDDGVHLIDFGADGEPLQRDELVGSRLRSRSRTPSPPNIDDIMGTVPTLPRRGSRSAMSDMGGPPYRQPSLRAPQQLSIRSQPASRQPSVHSRTPPLPSQPPSAIHSRPASSHASSQTSSRPRTPQIPTPHSMSRSSSHRSIPTPPKMTADFGGQTSDEEDESIPPPPPEETDIDEAMSLPPPAAGPYRSDDDDDDIPFGRSELKSTRV